MFGGGGAWRRVQRFLCGKTVWRTACLGALLALGCNGGKTGGLVVEPVEVTLPADGHEHRAFGLRGAGASTLDGWGGGEFGAESATGTGGGRGSMAGWHRRCRLPSKRFRVTGAGNTAAVRVRFILDPTDSYGGWHSGFSGGCMMAANGRRFGSGFASIAEAVADLPPERIPAEINDCSALLRYAYREALRNHDDQWIHVLRSGRRRWRGRRSRQYHYPPNAVRGGFFVPLRQELSAGRSERRELCPVCGCSHADAAQYSFRQPGRSCCTTGRPVFLSTT